MKNIKLNPYLVRGLSRSMSAFRFTYISDGLKVVGYCVRPRKGNKLPGIIMNRGGNRSFGMITDKTIRGTMSEIATWGYVVLGTQYRGNDGGEGTEDFGGQDVNDVLNLIPLFKRIPRADSTRIGMYGWSRGGMEIYRALTSLKNMKAAVIGAAQVDLIKHEKERPVIKNVYRKLIFGTGKTYQRELRKRSAIFWPHKIYKKTPILLLHGTSDWRVDVTHSLRMAEKLQENKHPYRLKLYEGANHSINEFRDDVNQEIRQWFDRYVKNREPLPNLKPHGK